MKNYKKTEHFEAVEMKCNEEQFNELKPILEKFDINIGEYNYVDYITNNHLGRINVVGNIVRNSVLNNERVVYETFNAETFLKACGIVEVDKTPSLEEVKEYFKNAKEVKCDFGVYKGIYELKGNEIIYDKQQQSYFTDTTNFASDVMLFNPKYGYAEIISYKEKTYQLSETFVKELCKEPNIKEAFIREGIIDETIEIKKSVILNTPNDLELVKLIRKMV